MLLLYRAPKFLSSAFKNFAKKKFLLTQSRDSSITLAIRARALVCFEGLLFSKEADAFFFWGKNDKGIFDFGGRNNF